jgi:hypothetical protein
MAQILNLLEKNKITYIVTNIPEKIHDILMRYYGVKILNEREFVGTDMYTRTMLGEEVDWDKAHIVRVVNLMDGIENVIFLTHIGNTGMVQHTKCLNKNFAEEIKDDDRVKELNFKDEDNNVVPTKEGQDLHISSYMANLYALKIYYST